MVKRVTMALFLAALPACGDEVPGPNFGVEGAGIQLRLNGDPDYLRIDVDGSRIADEELERDRKYGWDWGPGPVSVVVRSDRAGIVSFDLVRNQQVDVSIGASEITLSFHTIGG